MPTISTASIPGAKHSECREQGVIGHLALSEWVPRTLPFPGPFDLIYAYSVFTHLSEKTTRVALRLSAKRHRRRSARDHHPSGRVLAVRRTGGNDCGTRSARIAFVPHQREPIE